MGSNRVKFLNLSDGDVRPFYFIPCVSGIPEPKVRINFIYSFKNSDQAQWAWSEFVKESIFSFRFA